MQPASITKLNEWVQWFNWHADKVATYPMERKSEWTLKAINGLYECMTVIANELHRGGKRSRLDANMTAGGLLVPNSARFDGKH
jgi:hypothetical protein